jgi:Holliday junction DNA helicase RuvA
MHNKPLGNFMIHHLRGLLVSKSAPWLVIDVQGVGYELEVPLSTFSVLPEIQQEIYILTYFVVREDAHILYGFAHESERRFFKALIRVNGVGPKLALSILSAMDLKTFIHCVREHHINALTRIAGVGKKTAERLIVEMQDRLSELGIESAAEFGLKPNTASVAVNVTSTVEDAISALIALGYKPQEASRRVHAVEEVGLSSEMLIRRALQQNS